MSQTVTPPEDPIVEAVTQEWLTNRQQAIKDAAEMATRPTRQAIQFAVDALSLLPVGGNATARVRLLQAVEKLQIAISYLPETESPFRYLSR